MAAKQRDISVSEFFAKNRHLLGFDNPRKALLTTVKEAVDNSLDACEEAGILPEIWVHIEATGTNRFKVGVQDNGPGIVKKQIPLIFGKLLYGSKFHRLRMSRGQQGIGISAAGMYGVLTTGKPVKIISQDLAEEAGPLLRNPDRHQEEPAGDPQRQGRRRRHSGRREGHEAHRRSTASSGSIPGKAEPKSKRHARDDRARRRNSSAAAAASTSISSKRRSPIRTSRCTIIDPEGNETTLLPRSTDAASARAEGDQAASVRHRAGPAGDDAQGHDGGTIVAVSDRVVLAGQFRRRPQDLRDGQDQHAVRAAADRPARSRCAVSGDSGHARSRSPATDCISPIGEELILKGLHQVVPGEFYCAATRPPAVYRGNPFLIEVGTGLRRRSPRRRRCRSKLLTRIARRKRRPHAAAVPDEHVRRPGQRRGRQDLEGSRSWARGNRPRKLKQRRNRAAARRDEERQPLRRPNDAGAAVCQPRAAAVSAGGLRDHADGHRHQLAVATACRNRAATCRKGPVTVMVHMASVWVPFTSESKEAIASYPGDSKGTAARPASRRPQAGHVSQPPAEGEAGRRTAQIFLRYLGEVADGRQRSSTTSTTRDEALRAAAGRRQDARPPRPTRSSTTAARRSKRERGRFWRERADRGAGTNADEQIRQRHAG